MMRRIMSGISGLIPRNKLKIPIRVSPAVTSGLGTAQPFFREYTESRDPREDGNRAWIPRKLVGLGVVGAVGLGIYSFFQNDMDTTTAECQPNHFQNKHIITEDLLKQLLENRLSQKDVDTLFKMRVGDKLGQEFVLSLIGCDMATLKHDLNVAIRLNDKRYHRNVIATADGYPVVNIIQIRNGYYEVLSVSRAYLFVGVHMDQNWDPLSTPIHLEGIGFFYGVNPTYQRIKIPVHINVMHPPT